MTGQPPYDEDADRVLAGEYALGLLTPEEAARFEARMVGQPHLRALYAEWAEDFVRLTDDIPDAAPPAALKARIDADLFGASPSRRRPFAGWRGILWLVGGAVAATMVLLLAVDDGVLGPQPGNVPGYIADIRAEDGSLVLAASYDAASGLLYVERLTGVAPAGRSLELWLIAGENAPVSLGILPEDGTARLNVAADLRALMNGGLLAITDEPPGGSPTGAPTGTVLASGPVTSA
ncbi:anti-sigma factor [Roseovarius sp. M141]|uniref:anti-sigma factor n=1 Tax=Roseovarius sp. M141 TaxID=2583806 RepID=UPI0020CC87CF|nr:anti-sigma factor [Roseovarius sp. M141]